MMNKNLEIFINASILIGLVITIPLISILITMIFKIKMTPTKRMLLYSFASGLIIILGSVGFFGEAIEALGEHFNGVNSAENILTKIGILLGGAIFGFMIVMGSRYLSLKSKYDIHKHHEFHSHNDHITNYADIDNKAAHKRNAIFLLLSHRIIDGITLGLLASSANGIAGFSSWGMVIAFIVHLIPTTIIIFLTQVDIYENKWKALLKSFLMILITVPFTIAAAFLAEPIKNLFWLMPFLYSISGSTMILVSIIEIIPEFIHNKEMKTKKWYITILFLFLGIGLGILLMCIHTH